MKRLKAYIEKHVPLINTRLDEILPKPELRPTLLHESMRYATEGTGKRMRPLLCMMSSLACGGQSETALTAGCAIELIHTYSLIHDDLPCMDNDDIRRGKLTTHKAFDEAIAILAGDALQALAFQLLSQAYPDRTASPAIRILASAAGHVGMVGGQVLDLEGEGQELNLERIEAIDKWKTGSLISAACQIGGVVTGAGPEQLEVLSDYGVSLGLMYQITDDLLDIEKTSKEIGKTAGKDAKQEKLTYPAALGVEEARKLAAEKAADAKKALEVLGKDALMLRLLADYMLARKK